MTDDIATMRAAFEAVCRFYRAEPDVYARDWKHLVDAYTAPGRFYHNAAHIASMLRTFDKMKLGEADRVGLYAFALFHDIVYDTADQARYRQNETRSANLGRAFMERIGAPLPVAERLSQRIRATQTHDIDLNRDFNGAAAMDVDMGILAEKPRAYRRYADAIRLEFGHIPDDVFYPARLNGFLIPTLKKGRIFMTPAWQKREPQAHANMAAEIERIAKLGYAPA